jgi:hypothetical protein
MDKKKFNERMGRQKLSKGGYIKHIAGRAYFDDGGSTNLTSPTATNAPTTTSSLAPAENGVGNAINQYTNPANSLNPMNNLNPMTPLNAGVGILNGIAQATQNNFQASGAPIQNGTNQAQLQQAYNTAQTGLQQQQGLVNQLQGQNGVTNQNQAYNQTQGIINGTGPNPALATLNQQTGTNVANQAALMAGQRGGAQNAGLIARQAAQQGAATQQQAVGQAATNQAQQQLNAIGQASNIAQNQVNNLGQGITGLNTAAQNEQNTLQGANTAANTANVSMQSNLNNVNGQISQGNQSAMNGLLGGVTGGIGSAVSAIGSMFADGGPVDEQSEVSAPAPDASAAPVVSNLGNEGYDAIAGPGSSSIGQMGTSPDEGAAFKSSSGSSGGGGGGIASLAALFAKGGDVCTGPYQSHVANFLASGGETKKVPAMVSPGERYLSPEEVEQVQHGADPRKLGTIFKGKAAVKGDSLKNDKIPADLKSGGVVIPRHIMAKKDSHEETKFVLKSMKATGKHQPRHMRSPK